MRSTSDIIGKIQLSATQQDQINQLERERLDAKAAFEKKELELIKRINLLKNTTNLPADKSNADITNSLYNFRLEGGNISYDKNDAATTQGDAINNAIKADDPDILRSLIKTAIDQIASVLTYNHITDEDDGDNDLKKTVKEKIVGVIGTNGMGRLAPFYSDLKYGFNPINIGFLTKRDQPLLIEAILLRSSKCATLLLNEFDANPSTPYYNAVYSRGSYSYVSYDLKGDALALAIDCDLTDVALLLIQKGASLNTYYGNQDDTGYYSKWDDVRDLTPLMLAAMKNNYIIVKALLEKGAEYDRRNRDGKSAMQLSTNPEIIIIFDEHINKEEEKLREEICDHKNVMRITKNAGIFNQSLHAVKAIEEKLSKLASLRKSIPPTNTAAPRF